MLGSRSTYTLVVPPVAQPPPTPTIIPPNVTRHTRRGYTVPYLQPLHHGGVHEGRRVDVAGDKVENVYRLQIEDVLVAVHFLHRKRVHVLLRPRPEQQIDLKQESGKRGNQFNSRKPKNTLTPLHTSAPTNITKTTTNGRFLLTCHQSQHIFTPP